MGDARTAAVGTFSTPSKALILAGTPGRSWSTSTSPTSHRARMTTRGPAPCPARETPLRWPSLSANFPAEMVR